MPVDGGLGEEARVPQREIRPDHLLDHVQNRGNPGVVQERKIEGEHVGTVVDEFRMGGEQPVVIVPDRLDGFVRHAVVGNDEPVVPVLLQLAPGQHHSRSPDEAMARSRPST